MIKINLSPDKKQYYIGGKKYELHQIPFASYVIGLIIGILPVLFLDYYVFDKITKDKRAEIQRLKDTKRDLEIDWKRVKRNAEDLKNFITQREAFNQKLEVLANVVSVRNNPLDILQEVNRNIPSQAWLRELKFQRGGLSLLGSAVSLNDVNDFYRNLQNSTLFVNVQLTGSELDQNRQNFEIIMEYSEDG
jgi:Tfp pilus assembly protein PilN